MANGFELFRKYFNTPPALTIEWNDAELEARGWLVINSLRGNAAGGGTRMDPKADCTTPLFLAKTMEVKFQVAGPPIGGAKSVLKFDPSNPAKKREVLTRWFRHIRPLLREYYGTGGDLNVDMDEDVVPLMQSVVGVKHPQHGAIAGHWPDANPATVAAHVREGLARSTSAGSVASVASGYSVLKALEHYYTRVGDQLAGKRVIVEGLGSVGGSAGWFLHQAGARIVAAVTDTGAYPPRYRVVSDQAGLDVPSLLGILKNKRLPDGSRDAATADALWEHPADVFVPAAASGTVTEEILGRMRDVGVTVLASGANDPFLEEPGETRLQELADREFDILPDFVANCGTARAFSYLMDPGVPNEADSILAAIERSVAEATNRVVAPGGGPGRGILERAYREFVTPLV